MSVDKPIRAAATVVLARDSEDGMEVYLLRRSPKSSFMANVIVYPGGAVDAADFSLARSPLVQASRGLWTDDFSRAHAIAALREAFEESGLLAAEFATPPSQGDLDVLRREVHSGRMSFEAVLHELRASLPLDSLWYFDRWVTPSWETKRYDAWFFLMRAPEGQIAQSDELEVTDGTWMTPKRALELYRKRELLLAPPTWATIIDLARYSRTDEAAAFAQQATPYPILPHFTKMEGEEEGVILLPGDEAYPGFSDVDTTLRGQPRRTRIAMQDGLWVEHTRCGAKDTDGL